MFKFSINSNVLYIPPHFLAFHIPLTISLLQLKKSEISTLFQPIKLQIFCILTISSIIGEKMLHTNEVRELLGEKWLTLNCCKSACSATIFLPLN